MRKLAHACSLIVTTDICKASRFKSMEHQKAAFNCFSIMKNLNYSVGFAAIKDKTNAAVPLNYTLTEDNRKLTKVNGIARLVVSTAVLELMELIELIEGYVTAMAVPEASISRGSLQYYRFPKFLTSDRGSD